MNKSHLTAATVAIATTLVGIVKADVLYDTTGMTEHQSYNSQSAGVVIGGLESFVVLNDYQAADDFVLTETYNITSVTADYFMHPIGGESATPEDGVLVEFFSDVGGTPNEVSFAAVFSTEFKAVHFTDTVFGFPGKNNITRLTVDLSSEGITLEPGTWWASITPVNISDPDGWAYKWLRRLNVVNGNDLHVRDGGIDHGNGYTGFYLTYDWTPIDEINSPHNIGDVAMKIEGTLVGGCTADLDEDGSVGTSDLLELFAAWGKNPGSPADLDGDGTVNTADLLILFANWGPCP